MCVRVRGWLWGLACVKDPDGYWSERHVGVWRATRATSQPRLHWHAPQPRARAPARAPLSKPRPSPLASASWGPRPFSTPCLRGPSTTPHPLTGDNSPLPLTPHPQSRSSTRTFQRALAPLEAPSAKARLHRSMGSEGCASGAAPHVRGPGSAPPHTPRGATHLRAAGGFQRSALRGVLPARESYDRACYADVTCHARR